MAGFKKNRRGEKKSTEWPLCGRTPWTQDMVMQSAGGAGRIVYDRESYLTECLHWVSLCDPSRIRVPEEKTRRFRAGEGFTAAGKQYSRLSQLREKRVPEEFCWYQDIYGREVFYICKRKYIAMDVYDTMYDTRSYRWYFIREDQKLTRIYHDDESVNIYVTEDVREVEYDIWREMRNHKYFGS